MRRFIVFLWAVLGGISVGEGAVYTLPSGSLPPGCSASGSVVTCTGNVNLSAGDQLLANASGVTLRINGALSIAGGAEVRKGLGVTSFRVEVNGNVSVGGNLEADEIVTDGVLAPSGLGAVAGAIGHRRNSACVSGGTTTGNNNAVWGNAGGTAQRDGNEADAYLCGNANGCAPDAGDTRWLQCYVDFSIPTGAQITGMEVRVYSRRSSSAGNARWAQWQFLVNGAASPARMVNQSLHDGVGNYHSSGGRSDGWGFSSLSPSSVNTSNTGVRVAVTSTSIALPSGGVRVWVDHVEQIMWYTLPAPLLGGSALEYRMDECVWRNNVSDVNDASVNGLDATVRNGASTGGGGKVGRQAVFQRSMAQYVERLVPANIFASGRGFTAMAWVTFDGPNGHWERIFDAGNGPENANILFARHANSDHLSLHILAPWNGSRRDCRWVRALNAITNGETAHFAVSVSDDGQQVKIFKNGVELNTVNDHNNMSHCGGSLSGSSMKIDRVLYLGRSHWSGDAYTNGKVDEFKIFQGVLTPAQIQQIYINENAGKNWDGTSRSVVPCMGMTIGSGKVVEGNSGTTILNIPITLSQAAGVPLTVTWQWGGGTATGGGSCSGGVDFVQGTGSFTIPAGVTSAQIPITVCGDTTIEPDETIVMNTIEVRDPQGGLVWYWNTLENEIVNDDSALVLNYTMDQCFWRDSQPDVTDGSGNNRHAIPKSNDPTAAPLQPESVTTNGVTHRQARFDPSRQHHMVVPALSTNEFRDGFTVTFWAEYTADPYNFGWDRIFDFGIGASNHNILLARKAGTRKHTLHIYQGGTQCDVFNELSFPWDTIAYGQRFFYAVRVSPKVGTTPGRWQFWRRDMSGAIWGASGYHNCDIPANVTLNQNYIARSNWAADDYFRGAIDELKIFRGALPDTMINTIYNAERSGQQHNGSAKPPLNCGTISVTGRSVVEGNGSPATVALFDVSLSQPAPPGGVVLSFQYIGGNATGGSSCGAGNTDFESTTTSVTIPAGASSGQIALRVCRDRTPESDETIVIGNFSATAGYTVATANATATLVDDDQPALVQCFTDNFDRTFLGGWWQIIKMDNFTPRVDNNALMLTDLGYDQATGVTLNGTFPAANNYFEVEFRHRAFPAQTSGVGVAPADGVVVVFSDAAVTPVAGAFGGSLGYANRCGHSGFAGGWVGVGLDEYGNFSNGTECRNGGPGFIPDAVAIRGSAASGYPYLGGSGSLTPGIDGNSPEGPNHLYRITFDTRYGENWVKVDRNTGSGYTTVVPWTNITQTSTAPANFRMSFTAGTGAGYNIHKIDDLSVRAVNCGSFSQALNHLRLEWTPPALTCAPLTVTVKACADAACSQLYLQPVTVTLRAQNPSSGGDGRWATGTIPNAGNGWTSDVTLTFTGSTSVALNNSQAGAVTLGVVNISQPPQQAMQCVVSGAVGSCSVTFQSVALQWGVRNGASFIPLSALPSPRPMQVAGKAINVESQSAVDALTSETGSNLALRIVGPDPNNPNQCAGITGSYPTTLVLNAVEPTAIASAPSLQRNTGSGWNDLITTTGSSSPTVSLGNLSFNASGVAGVADIGQLRYRDAGRIFLTAQVTYTPPGTGNILSLSDSSLLLEFRPLGLCVTAEKQGSGGWSSIGLAPGPNRSEAQAATDPVVLQAGEEVVRFRVRPVGWEGVNDGNWCAGNPPTPNFRTTRCAPTCNTGAHLWVGAGSSQTDRGIWAGPASVNLANGSNATFQQPRFLDGSGNVVALGNVSFGSSAEAINGVTSAAVRIDNVGHLRVLAGMNDYLRAGISLTSGHSPDYPGSTIVGRIGAPRVGLHPGRLATQWGEQRTPPATGGNETFLYLGSDNGATALPACQSEPARSSAACNANTIAVEDLRLSAGFCVSGGCSVSSGYQVATNYQGPYAKLSTQLSSLLQLDPSPGTAFRRENGTAPTGSEVPQWQWASAQRDFGGLVWVNGELTGATLRFVATRPLGAVEQHQGAILRVAGVSNSPTLNPEGAALVGATAGCTAAGGNCVLRDETAHGGGLLPPWTLRYGRITLSEGTGAQDGMIVGALRYEYLRQGSWRLNGEHSGPLPAIADFQVHRASNSGGGWSFTPYPVGTSGAPSLAVGPMTGGEASMTLRLPVNDQQGGAMFRVCHTLADGNCDADYSVAQLADPQFPMRRFASCLGTGAVGACSDQMGNDDPRALFRYVPDLGGGEGLRFDRREVTIERGASARPSQQGN
ncbi:MAG: hypothetical protein N2557_07050 [Hydrogenophilus sp.]|nr:hypothetical protein [Hydrogenophilus sp.]